MYILVFLVIIVASVVINLIALMASIASFPWILLVWTLAGLLVWWLARRRYVRRAPQRAADREFRRNVHELLVTGRQRSNHATREALNQRERRLHKSSYGDLVDLDDLDWDAEA